MQLIPSAVLKKRQVEVATNVPWRDQELTLLRSGDYTLYNEQLVAENLSSDFGDLWMQTDIHNFMDQKIYPFVGIYVELGEFEAVNKSFEKLPIKRSALLQGLKVVVSLLADINNEDFVEKWTLVRKEGNQIELITQYTNELLVVQGLEDNSVIGIHVDKFFISQKSLLT